jgi:hypothetical protein
MDKKKIINSFFFILAGVIISLLILGIYTRLLTPLVDKEESQILPPLNLVDKDVFITAITGEVFIIREEKIQTALIGDALFEGDVLKVVDQSYCQIQFADRGSAGLDSNTVMLMKKLVNADNFKIRTEVLMGSMMYRVKKLDNNDDFEVESEGVLYDITGTEFLVVNSLDGFLLAVKEGSVQVTSLSHGVQEMAVKDGEEIYLSKDEIVTPQVIPLGESASDRMVKLQGFKVIEALGNPSIVTVTVNPVGAEIYVNGRKSGMGTFTGLFEGGTELEFLVRKQGYKDITVHHTVEIDKNKDILIQLIPSGLVETLDTRFIPIESILNNKIAKQEQELSLLEEKYQSEKENMDFLKSSSNSLVEENKVLQDEIKKKNDEINKLKQLISQIGELTEQN